MKVKPQQHVPVLRGSAKPERILQWERCVIHFTEMLDASNRLKSVFKTRPINEIG